jgi:hypothetical protein
MFLSKVWHAASQRTIVVHLAPIFFAEMTHHSTILLTLDDLEQVDDVLVEIEHLSAQLEVCITQQIQLLFLLNVLKSENI